jgi:DnaD/phage-associated family protein
MYNFEESKTFLYSDTPVPDIFISEYLPEMTGIQVKIYLYCLFLSKNKKKISEMQFAKTFGLSEEEISGTFDELVKKGLFQKKGKGFILTDLKGKEINKLYKPRTTPNAMELDTKKDIVSSINKGFFQGIMPISWYQNIEMWFNLYKFEDEVMFMLFNYCNERGLLKFSYVNAVAKNWAEAGIKNEADLDEYFMKYKKMKEISTKIAKKLNRTSRFTEYEERYISKWVDDYGYGMDIIDLALKKTVRISNPNLEYVHKVLTGWHKDGFRTPADIEKGAKKYAASRNNGSIDEMMLKKQVRDHYAEVKSKNNKVLESRKEEVFKKVPEIQKLLSDIANLSIDSLAMKKDEKQDAFSKIDVMKEMAASLLKSNGFAENYLEPVYDCEKCLDTGALPDGNSCSCRKKLIKELKGQ